MAKREGVDNVYVHAFLDGRDTPPTSGITFVAALEDKMKELGVGKIASLSGRFYAMDRDNRWDRVEKAYRNLTEGNGVQATSAKEAMQASYDNDVTDEFVLPTTILENGAPVAVIKDGDSIGIFIGPEGGFDEKEVTKASESGFVPITLGRRILRTETAAMTVMSWLVFLFDDKA